MASLALRAAIRTDIGARPNNEDAAFASPRMAAVADGVGGRAAGEVASRWAINALVSLDKRWVEGRLESALRDAVRWGNQAIAFLTACRPPLAGMCATLTAIAVDDHRGYVVAHVGDSRAYLMRDTELTRLTRDDSLVGRLIEQGVLAPEQAAAHPQRSVVLAAVDGSPDLAPAIDRVQARVGDRLLVCSDGLTDVVDESAIAATLRSGAPGTCAERLVALALGAGGRDNITVVVADVLAATSRAAGWARADRAA